MTHIVNISVNSRIFIWANSDLDGAASTITLGNIFTQFDYQSVFFGNFEEAYTAWANNNLEDYDKVFIIGMVVDQTLLNKIDDPRIVLISDRGERLNSFDSTIITEQYSSCCRLIYSKFKNKVEFTQDLKKLILYVDDYNRYDLKYEESKYLNALYRKMGYKRFSSFVDRFWNGFDGFTESEVMLADTFFEEINKEVKSLDIYTGEFRDWKVVSTFSKLSVNEISKSLIDNTDADVIIVINPDSKFVSFRKPNASKADIKYMAENLCNGGGGEWAAGGSITQKFLDFATKLTSL